MLNRTDIIKIVKEHLLLLPEQTEETVNKLIDEVMPQLKASQLEPLVMQKIAEVSEKDYEEYYNSPAVQEFMNAPGGKPQKIKLADLNYYKNIIATQNDSEILKLELQDLIKDIEEEREQR